MNWFENTLPALVKCNSSTIKSPVKVVNGGQGIMALKISASVSFSVPLSYPQDWKSGVSVLVFPVRVLWSDFWLSILVSVVWFSTVALFPLTYLMTVVCPQNQIRYAVATWLLILTDCIFASNGGMAQKEVRSAGSPRLPKQRRNRSLNQSMASADLCSIAMGTWDKTGHLYSLRSAPSHPDRENSRR